MRLVLGFALILSTACALAQQGSSPSPSAVPSAQSSEQQASGSISGTVVDRGGDLAVGAQVKLTRDQFPTQEALTGDNGQFAFANLPAGTFELTVSAPDFETQVVPVTLQAGEVYLVPEIVLSVATAVTEVKVEMTQEEVAQVEIKEQEQQRVFGFIPNFYVTYSPDPAPLVPRQKFQLAWKSSTDPVTFLGAATLAGIEQASDDFGGYGQGMEGYAKRLGATYADVFIGTFLGSAILPSLLKQDPRYFYRGTGSNKSRLMYALANSVICKGDNKKWQPNYSGIIGSFATGGISYLYYPASDRSAELLIQNSLIRIAESSIAGVFQEFVLRKLTSHSQKQNQPPSDQH